MRRREDIWLDGIKYTRFPDSKNKHQRNYFWPPRKSGKQALHREIWKKHYGPIPAGKQIHHKDHDPTNNEPSNLKCLTRREHAAEHAEEYRDARRTWVDTIRPLAAKWHSTPEGRAWHSEHGKQVAANQEPVTIICVECGCSAERFPKSGVGPFCSRKCSRAAADSEKRYVVAVACPICGNRFDQNKYRAKPTTCSRICGASLRKRQSASVQHRS